MVTANNEWGFYQIPHSGLMDIETEHVRTGTSNIFRRTTAEKLSNFGALWVGDRMAVGTDYTRTVLDFQTKDELGDWHAQTEDTGVGSNVAGRSVNVDHNPYVVGSTVKKVRDDQFFRMGMDDNAGNYIDQPNFDVMDQKESSAAGMEAYKNYPSEGWRSFGGKYDFLPYTGVLR